MRGCIGTLGLIGLVACSPAQPSGSEAVLAPDLSVATSAGARLALACAGCHSDVSGAIASLSTYDEATMIATLQTYKSDPIGTTVMHRLARGYSDEDIRLVSVYLTDSDSLK